MESAVEVYEKMMGYEPLEKIEEFRLLKEAQSGLVESQNRLVLHNMRGVAKICHYYANDTIIRHELYALGIEALIECILVYQPKKYNNIRLITFARKAIHSKLQKSNEVNRSGIIIPPHLRQLQYHISNALKHIEVEKCSLDELVDYIMNETNVIKTSVSRDIIKFLIRDFDNLARPASLNRSAMPLINSKSQAEMDSEFPLMNLISDNNADHTTDVQVEIDLKKIIQCLTEKEKEIVYRRWGILPYETVEETGKRFGVTKGRISKIYVEAMRKLKWEADRLSAGNKGIINQN